jgi:uncharacterized Zn finger protein (UPF0148 family)
MSEPARGLRNVRNDDGTIFCPKCEKPILPHESVVFRDDYALHVRCAYKAEDVKAM